MFNQYDSISNNKTNTTEKNENIKMKKSNIIKKLNLIFFEFNNNSEKNMKNISLYIDNLIKQKNININIFESNTTNNREENNSVKYSNSKSELKIEKK